MNTPNKLTVVRIMCTPAFYAIFLLQQFIPLEFQLLWVITLACLWIFLEVTDVLDGYIARKYGLVSDLGKLMDPFGDVLSRVTFFYCFVHAGIYPAWPLLIIFWRELSVTFIRAVLAKTGIALAASRFGKVKAVCYFIASAYGIFLLFVQVAPYRFSWPVLNLWANILFYITMLASVLSFIPYFIRFIKTDYIQQQINQK